MGSVWMSMPQMKTLNQWSATNTLKMYSWKINFCLNTLGGGEEL